MESIKRAESALRFVSSDSRDTWIKIGMSLKSEFGECAFDLFIKWSSEADSFKLNDAISAWRSFSGTGITISTLFFTAKQNGWNDKEYYKPDHFVKVKPPASLDIEAGHLAASKKAGWILQQSKPDHHDYLRRKGFGALKADVWSTGSGQALLCIPMRLAGGSRDIQGIQLIACDGTKRFLKGQKTAGCEYLIENAGIDSIDFFVEGFATALSLRECLKALGMRYRIHVAFSAFNLIKIAKKGCVIADRDTSGIGEKSAIQTGLPYFLPECGDFNDLHRRKGTFKAAQELRTWLFLLKK